MPSRIEVKLVMTKDNVPALRKALKYLIDNDVLVGVPQSRTQRKSGTITNAALAYIHNTGSPARNIPARPFMEPGIKNATERISQLMRQVANAALKGNQPAVRRGLESVGLVAQNSIRSKINEGIPPPLKHPRPGKSRDKPLIDTGQMRNSITYVIRRKGA